MSSPQLSRPSRSSLPAPSASNRAWLCAAWLAALVCLTAAASAAEGERRVALVIGNGAYSELDSLKNPVNDASDVAAALEGLGFDVLLGIDIGRQRMAELIVRYTRKARQADVSLFYYAGHGFQVDDLNYLVPVDATLAGTADVAEQTIRLDDVTDDLEDSEAIHLVFLDACRNNPLGELVEGAGAAVRDGLARIGDAAGFLFAFATQPDNVAYDGVGRNSFFTQAVLSHMPTPGQDIASMMIAVRRDVLAATGGKQVPWENSSLTRQFRFDPRPPTASPETMLWQIAARAEDPALMRIYLHRYPEGAHVTDAREFLGAVQPPTEEGQPRTLPEGDGGVPEQRLWDLARQTRMRQLVQAYLDRYPAGRYGAEAQRLLEALPRADAAGAPGPACERLATHPRDATANTAGVPFPQLESHAGAAVEACRKAAEAHPDLPHFTALLARATAAAGDREEAIRLYREAAGRGDLRAMVSLGLIMETGDGVPRDVQGALDLYEQAATGGSPDGAINLAVALFEGTTVERDAGRALELLVGASAAGSAIATYNLGVLAQQGVAGTGAGALEHFRKAVALGEPRGYQAAAILLDEGRGTGQDHEEAAEMILRGVASDNGEMLGQMTDNAAAWTRATIAAVQERLERAGLYEGEIDGISGERFAAALRAWRNGGFLNAMPDS